MAVDPIVFYNLSAISFILGIALAIVIVFYSKSLRENHKLRREKEKLDEEMYRKADVLMEETRGKAMKIIEDANFKAESILKESRIFAGKSAYLLDEKLKNVSQDQIKNLQQISGDFLESYQKILKELKKDNINMFSNISKDIEREAVNEVKDFKEILQKETVESQKIVEQKIEEEYEKVRKGVEEYKSTQLGKVDDSIYKIIACISEELIGKALSQQEHQDLVLKALEKAKKEYLS